MKTVLISNMAIGFHLKNYYFVFSISCQYNFLPHSEQIKGI